MTAARYACLLGRLVPVVCASLAVLGLSAGATANSHAPQAAVPRKVHFWIVNDGSTTWHEISTLNGKTWTYDQKVTWHLVWRFGVILGTAGQPLEGDAYYEGTTGWADPGSWVVVVTHSYDPNVVSTDPNAPVTNPIYCANAHTFTAPSAFGATEPRINGVSEDEASIEWDTWTGGGFCAAPSGYVPNTPTKNDVFYASQWHNKELFNLAQEPLDETRKVSQPPRIGHLPGPATGTAVLTDNETLHISGNSPPPEPPPKVKVPTPKTAPPPRSCTPKITSVAFHGGPAHPSVVVRGACLGSRPQPQPPGHPSGLNGCPTVAGDNGYLYGTNLYLALPSANWAAGRYRPELNETDCLDLVVTKFTPTEVDFHFGQPYVSFYPKFSLAPGSQVQVGVNGLTYDATVKYG
jgi:hypothetical protein